MNNEMTKDNLSWLEGNQLTSEEEYRDRIKEIQEKGSINIPTTRRRNV